MDPEGGPGTLDYGAVPHNKLKEVLLQKAQELFVICDKEDKGFITKDDMQSLRGELPLTPEQLTEVFDALDDDRNGTLTLDEFTDGFGMFLGIDTKRRRLSRSWDEEPIRLSQELVSPIPEEDGEEFNNLLNQLGAQHVFEDEDYIREVWDHLRQDNPEILKNFEHFLAKVTTELSETREDFSKLEWTLKSRTNQHQEHVQQLYQEMEEQMKSASEEMLAKEKSREMKVRAELATELFEKDKQLQDMLAQHTQMETRLKELNSGEVETKVLNLKLQKEKETLERRLQDSEKILMDLRQYIDNLNKQALEERRRRARAALQVSEGIALEREGLVKQLDLLRTVNRKLLDEKDEISSSSKRGSLESNVLEGETLVHFAPPYQTNEETLTNPSRHLPGREPNSDHTYQRSVATTSPWREKGDDQFFQAGTHTPSPDTRTDHFSYNLPPEHEKRSEPHRQQSLEQEDCEVDDQFFQVMGQGTSTEGSVVFSNNFNFPGTSAKTTKVTNTHPLDISDDENANEAAVLSPNCVTVDSLKPTPRPRVRQTPQMKTEKPPKENKDYKKRDSIVNPERLFKIVFMGDSGVGKTSFIHRFCHGTFKGTFSATVGVDFQVKSISVDGRLIAVQLWDTAGQERFRSITKQYFRKADGIIIMYDVTSEMSFKNVRNWIASVKEGADERVVLMLIGNKTDLCESDEDRVVKTKDGTWLADEFGTLFYEVSAKTGSFVSESITGLASLLQEREDEEMERALQLQSKDIKRKKCC